MSTQNRLIRPSLAVGLAIFVTASTAWAEIDLEWRPAKQVVEVGDTVGIGLYAVSDDDENQLLGALDIIIVWNPDVMRLLGVDNEGAPDWAVSDFLQDPFRVNEELPPQDGDGLYTGWSSPEVPIAATPQGTLMTTFQFEALRATQLTELILLKQIQKRPMPMVRTKVFDWWIPNKDVTGKLGSPAEVTVDGGECAGDERIKRPRCKNKRGLNLLTVKLVGGVEGDSFTVELPSGKKKEGTINSKGRGKAKFKKLPPGEGKATAKWGCGAEAEKKYACP